MTMPVEHQTVALTLNWRDAKRTQCCVECLLDQDIDHVLIWDNSADEGISFSELSRTFSQNKRVSVIQSPTNLGFAAGVNRGIDWIVEKYPSAEFALLINNDATMVAGGVTELRNALRARPEAWLAHPDINHGGRIFGLAYYHRWTGLLTLEKLPGSFSYTSGCCQLFALKRIPLPVYDEDFFMYGEDIELGWRLLRKSGSSVHVQRTLVYHEGSASSKMGSPFYEQRMIAAHCLLVGKLVRARREIPPLIAGRVLCLPARALVRAWRYRSTAPLKAIVIGFLLVFSTRGKHS